MKKLLLLLAFLGLVVPAAAQTAYPLNAVTSQVSCATSATAAAPLRAGRNSVTVENTGTVAVYIGAAGVTTATGMLLPGTVGASITVPGGAALYCVVGTGTQAISILETY